MGNKDSKKRLIKEFTVLPKPGEPSVVFYFLLLVLYLLSYFMTARAAKMDGVYMIMGHPVPIASFTGVFSSFANICVMFLAVFYKKRGYITALVLLLFQLPWIFRNIIVSGELASIQGIFSDLFTIVAITIIHLSNKKIDNFRSVEIEYLKDQQKFSQHLFEQTATALVNAIDAKDTYSHGHSLRVAEYSERIARAMGRSAEECYKIYYTALLHDVGKIGIDDSIINKKGKLTPEEYEIIKQHPAMGNQILSSINEYPYLSIGAHFHHERYDGKGYPVGLKGDDIPEIARIISVADAYDAMSSNRSYRDAIPQQLVREEIVKGAGTQFDPEISKVMQHLIDMDTEYRMKERAAVRELAGNNELHCGEYRSVTSDGVLLSPRPTRIHLKYSSVAKTSSESRPPAMIIFDSLDGRVHEDERTIGELNYFEYCELWFDGHSTETGARKLKTGIIDHEPTRQIKQVSSEEIEYDVEAVKCKDHILIRIDDGLRTVEATIALPDSSRFAYFSLTGEECDIFDVSITEADEEVPIDYIPRIAEEISYIKNVPEGDIPNIQIDGQRTDATEGIPVIDGMRVSFHTMSLPTARLIWHCPYFVLFYSDDKKVRGEGYREYALVRLDGEKIGTVELSENRTVASQEENFAGWDAWKKANKEGFDCVVRFERKNNRITMITENLGMSVKSVTTINDGIEDIYFSLTGDQVALTGIRIVK
ncbi:MAG: HD-GYP domain-containing protein [Lachnospiraceae bacterium]|nr:HD-GYP domain-containing protein [Lachnospiraceae bacterium]